MNPSNQPGDIYAPLSYNINAFLPNFFEKNKNLENVL